MLNGIDLTIGTGGQHVFRTGGPAPEYLAQIARPTFLARARGSVYGVSEIGHGRIFRIGGAPIGYSTSGALRIGGIGEAGDGLAGEPISSGGAHPCHISADPGGEWLYVSNYGDGVVRAVRIEDDGGFGEALDLTHSGSGPVSDRQAGPHAHSSAVVGDHLVIADLGTDHLRVHPLTAGRPDPDGFLVQMPAGSGPRHFTQIGDRLIVAGELNGSLTEVSTQDWLPGRSVPAATVRGEHHLSHVIHTPEAIIVGVRGSNTLSVLDHDLTLVQEVPTTNWPRHFALARVEGEAGIVVAGERSDEVAWHAFETEGGGLCEVRERLAVPTPMFIGVGEEF